MGIFPQTAGTLQFIMATILLLYGWPDRISGAVYAGLFYKQIVSVSSTKLIDQIHSAERYMEQLARSDLNLVKISSSITNHA